MATLEIPDSINPDDCLHIDTEPSYVHDGNCGKPIHGLLRVWAKYDVAHLTPDSARAVAAALIRWADTGELK